MVDHIPVGDQQARFARKKDAVDPGDGRRSLGALQFDRPWTGRPEIATQDFAVRFEPPFAHEFADAQPPLDQVLAHL